MMNRMAAPEKILITGGAGFIGYHLARHLLTATKADLVSADNLQRGRMDDAFDKLIANPRVRFMALDLTNAAAYGELGTGFTHIYHLAAINGTKNFYEMPHEVLRINILSLFFVLDWMRAQNPGAKICFTSSNEAYAGGLHAFGALPFPTPEAVPLVIEDPYNPRWSYAGTKLIGEQIMIHYATKYGLRGLVVRPHNFYGPRAGYEHVIPQLSLRIASREDPFALMGADETRSFCYIEDAVRAMRMLMESSATDGQPIETVHIGDRNEVSVAALADALFAIAGWTPRELVRKPAPAGSVKRRLPDITKLERLAGWRPEIPFEEGLRRTYEWYKDHPNKTE
ncbi:NAD-dependent epimerase/dehydratase family protein [Candidatus Parcubacteria bacterium]|nr:MAG: NAD-dependent epimerase/dehydratase family protein [Candidatus Parcubacteria bacterium]